jgi:phage host-nuclease inhibitor protein Gam
VNDDRGALDEPLAEQVQKQNTNLQSLIETITQMIAASRDLLQRLGGAEGGPPPPDAEP